jgi:hypothetical protein
MNTRDKILKEIEFFGGKDFDKKKELDLTDEGELIATLKKAKLEGYDLAQKEILEKIKKLWKEKCKRMKIMSGDVAIYELNNILDEIKGDKKE